MRLLRLHPANLVLRLLLEIAMLATMAYWGWTQHTGWLRFGLAIGLPVLAALIWGIFNVPDDTSRSGRAPVPVPGVVRLMLEFSFFGSAVWMLYDAGAVLLSFIMGAVVIIHYVASYDRVLWLLKQKVEDYHYDKIDPAADNFRKQD